MTSRLPLSARPLLALLLAIGLGFTVAVVHADPAQVQTGTQRAVFAKGGTRLSATPSGMGARVKSLPYGTRVRVEEVRGRWLRVTEFQGTQAGASGWVKASATVEPYALSQGGAQGAPTAGQARAAGLAQRDVSAASRQFSESTEGAHRRASRAALQRAYDLLDAVVEVRKPRDSDVDLFIQEGGLGRPGGRSPAGSQVGR